MVGATLRTVALLIISGVVNGAVFTRLHILALPVECVSVSTWEAYEPLEQRFAPFAAVRDDFGVGAAINEIWP